jgi:hypothetical protein
MSFPLRQNQYVFSERNTELVKQAIQSFHDKMAKKIVDEMAVVHIIGAFSAGKSRLVRELLRGYHAAHDLLPISSQERQSALPLEITYGEVPRLLRMGENGDVTHLPAFPVRDEQRLFDASTYRLRLELPEPELLLGDVALCSAEEGIKRLVVKDMPGWNSGDSFVAENALAGGLVGADNISLVYVVRANGVDSQDDLSRLHAIFTAVEAGDAFFYNGFHLVVVVTRCEDVSEHAAITSRITERLQQLAEDVGIEDVFTLSVLCVDFGKEQEDLNHAAFISRFWELITKPIADKKQIGSSAASNNRSLNWKKEWLIQSKIIASLDLMNAAQHWLNGFKKEDKFIAHMNSTRLLGLSKEECCLKLHTTWMKQVGVWQPSREILSDLVLDDDHPLAQFWNGYWLGRLGGISGVVDDLALIMENAIKAFPLSTVDVEGYFHDNVEKNYTAAMDSLDNSFYCVAQSLDAIKHEKSQEKVVATLLSLSLLDAKYADYYYLLNVVID